MRPPSAAGFSTQTRTLAIEAANVVAFGSIRLVQLFVLDRVRFAGNARKARSPLTGGSELHRSWSAP